MPDTPLAGRHALITGGGTGHRRRRRRSAQRRWRQIIAARTPAGAASGRRRKAWRTAIQCDVTDPARIAARLRRSARGQRPDRPADRQCRDRRERALPQDDARRLGPDHRHQPHRGVRLRAGGDRRPAQERQWPAGLRRLRREPARRALCLTLRRVEAWPPRPDAQPRRGICEDDPHRERGLPGLCRHADDRPICCARVRDHRPQRGRCALGDHQHECEWAAGRPAGDRQRSSPCSACP